MARYSTHTDEELVGQLKQDNEAAFRELYNRYWERLMAFARLQLGNAEDAEELLQDIFVQLWNRRDTLALKYSFHTYISAAVKYSIFRKLAERSKKRMVELSPDYEQADTSTQAWLDFRELREQLEAEVSLLPERMQLVFRLSREQGLDRQALARTLDITPKTVENQIHLALKKLRSSLQFLFSLLF